MLEHIVDVIAEDVVLLGVHRSCGALLLQHLVHSKPIRYLQIVVRNWNM